MRIDVLKRFGYYSTESNGHLCEYLPWYRKRPDEILQLDRHVRLDPRRDRRLPALLHREPQLVRDRLPEVPRGGRQAARRVQAHRRARLATSSRRWRPGAPTAATSTSATTASSPTCRDDCIIESPGFVDRFGINMVAGVRCPWPAPPPARASVNVQRMSVEAAMTGDVDAPEAGRAARPAGRRDLHPGRGLADGRRAARRAGAVAAAVRRRHPGGRASG